MTERSILIHSRRTGPGGLAVLGLVFFGICLGLAYPCLKRYSPDIGDCVDYIDLVRHPIPKHPDSHRPYRVLMPLMARPLYWAIRNHGDGIDPAAAALVVVCCAASAATAAAIVVACEDVGLSGPVAALAGCLYLLNFWISNDFLVALVDGGEALAGVLLVIGLWRGRAWLVVVATVGGALTKETFVVLGSTTAAVWWLIAAPPALRWRLLGVIVGAFVLAAGAVWTVRLFAAGAFVSPLTVATSFRPQSRDPLLKTIATHVLDRQFWYGLFWLLPLACFGLRAVDRRWLVPTVAAAMAALALGIYHQAGPSNVARPMFSMAGPALCAAAAAAIGRITGGPGPAAA